MTNLRHSLDHLLRETVLFDWKLLLSRGLMSASHGYFVCHSKQLKLPICVIKVVRQKQFI